MDAYLEIQEWLKQHRKLEQEPSRQAFYQHLAGILGGKSDEAMREGLIALSKSVQETRQKTKKATPPGPSGYIQVYPNSREEQELLQKLFMQMGIPFKVSD